MEGESGDGEGGVAAGAVLGGWGAECLEAAESHAGRLSMEGRLGMEVWLLGEKVGEEGLWRVMGKEVSSWRARKVWAAALIMP